jgi:hypothetical protein
MGETLTESMPFELTNPVGTRSEIEMDLLPKNRQDRQHDRITQALTQVLQPIGVKFKFSVKRHHRASTDDEFEVGKTQLQSPLNLAEPLEHRLWVVCYSQKSLDCQVLAEPLTKNLRKLNLQGFQDAVIQFSRPSAQVADWRLRIDLTPAEVILQRWSRWGDVQAITQLLNLTLKSQRMQVSAVLKSLTLHVFCHLDPQQRQTSKFPQKKLAVDTIAPLLTAISPQGIQGATIYGVQSKPDLNGQMSESPIWMQWLDLPALGDPSISPTPLALAERGDETALAFVLERFLNPDLEQCLEIGGISLALLRRRHLLHVMTEAPLCPLQSQVASPVIKVLRQLNLPGMIGVRIYGRVSGNVSPTWTYGIDFDRSPLGLPAVRIESKSALMKSEQISLTWVEQLQKYLVASKIWQRQDPRSVFTGSGKPPLRQVTAIHGLKPPQPSSWYRSLVWLGVGLSLALPMDMLFKSHLDLSTKAIATTKSTEDNGQLSFNNTLLEKKLTTYRRLCAFKGAPDVLIVGSSRALRGVDPQILQQQLSERGYRNLRIYNFGINGATAQVVDTLLRQLLTPKQLPKLVIWADGARAFNSGRNDRTYESIALSTSYRQLVTWAGDGGNPLLMQAQSSVRNSFEAFDTQVNRQLGQISTTYTHRDQFKSWLKSPISSFDIIPFFETSLDPHLSPVSLTIPDSAVRADGFLPLDLQFDPQTYYQQYTKVTGDSDGDYANFQLTGIQHQAVEKIITLLAQRKIPLIFVNIPLSDIYLDKYRQHNELKFKEYMRSLAQMQQLAFVDMDGFLNNQYDRFSDPSHLNRWGASEVTRYLAQTNLIPWQIFTTTTTAKQLTINN